MPPYQPNLLMPQLEGGIPIMQLGGGQTVFQTAQGTPFIYGSMSMPGPTDMGNQIANSIVQVLAPLVARMTGMQNPQFAPNIGSVFGGVSPWAGYYMRDVQRPLYEASRDQYLWQWGGTFGGMAGQMAGAIGDASMADRFRQNVSGVLQSQAGRSLTQLLLSTSGVQGVVGGDYMQMFDMIYGNRHNLRGGVGMTPMDLASQRTLSQQTMDLVTDLTQRMVGPGGTPNYAFTRGFDPTAFGQMAQYLGQRGAAGFAGMWTPAADATAAERTAGYASWRRHREETLGQTAKALEAISELVGGGTAEQLIGALDRLSQGVQRNDWRAAATRITGQVQSLSAAAKVFGVSGPQAMQMMEAFQTSMGMAAGISPQNPLGLSAGGYNSAGIAGTLATIAMGTADVMGVRGDPTALARITAQQSAMMHTAFNSPMGWNTRMMAWAAGTERISRLAWEEYNQAIRAGEFERANGMVNRMLEGTFGSATSGRQILMAAPALMGEQTGEEFRLAAVGTMNQGMGSQLARDMFNQSVQETHRQAMIGLHRMGVSSVDPAISGGAAREAALERIRRLRPELGDALVTAAESQRTWADLQQFLQAVPGFSETDRDKMRAVRDDVLGVGKRAGRLREAEEFTRIAAQRGTPEDIRRADAVRAGTEAARRLERGQSLDELSRLAPKESLELQTALVGYLRDINNAETPEARQQAIERAKRGIRGTQTLGVDGQNELINAIETGADPAGLLRKEGDILKSMQIHYLRQGGDLGVLNDAATLRMQGERRAFGMGGSIALQKAQEQRFNDVMQNMRMPFGQRLWSTMTGAMTVWEAIGITEDQAKGILDYKQRGALEKGFEAIRTGKAGLDTVTSDLRSLVNEPGVTAVPGAQDTMLTAAKHVAEAAGKGDKDQVEQAISQGVTALKQVGKDGQRLPDAEIEKWVKNQRALVGTAEQMKAAEKSMSQQVTDDQMRQINLRKMQEKYHGQVQASDARRTLNQLGIDPFKVGTIFVGDIDPNTLVHGKGEKVDKALTTLLELSGRKEGFWERVTGGILGPSVQEKQQMVMELSLPENRAKLNEMLTGPNQDKALSALAELAKYSDVDSRRKPEGKEGKGRERVDLVGTLTLYDSEGVNIGIVNNIKPKSL